jgi:predicted HicB family RNase H-like nuclease
MITSKQFTFKMDVELSHKLKILAVLQKKSLKQLIEECLSKMVRESKISMLQ